MVEGEVESQDLRSWQALQGRCLGNLEPQPRDRTGRPGFARPERGGQVDAHADPGHRDPGDDRNGGVGRSRHCRLAEPFAPGVGIPAARLRYLSQPEPGGVPLLFGSRPRHEWPLGQPENRRPVGAGQSHRRPQASVGLVVGWHEAARRHRPGAVERSAAPDRR